jgi:glucose/arabinose dehydrogenase
MAESSILSLTPRFDQSQRRGERCVARLRRPNYNNRLRASGACRRISFASTKVIANMSRICWSLVVLAVQFPACSLAQVDERPLNVQVVPAFPQIEWPEWVTGLDVGRPQDPRPLLITGAGDATDRIFVVSQYGSIHVFPNDPQADELKTFLDIRDRVQYDHKENEEGLLGLAFHPRYKENGEFFVYYSIKRDPNPHITAISRFRVSKDDPDRADPDSEEVLLTIKHPYWNHKGGTIVFGPDGYLYVGLGDGGAANDPHGNGQNLGTLLGSILRIDVDKKDPGLEYAIPKDNPFAGQPGKRGEIWAYGIRNVWRIAFDRETGALWAGDVGQNLWEEIDIIRRGGNYGWNIREGKHPFAPSGSNNVELIEPIWEYHHDVGKSITGGHVYRGRQVPELRGAYLYADFVTGQVWALWYDAEKEEVAANRTILPKGLPLMSFGEDDEGEVYFVTQEGGIHKFASPKKTASR